jgi:hypothetical protein
MGPILFHNLWVQFYLLYVGAWAAVFVWDALRPRRATREDPGTPPREAAHERASRPPADGKNLPRPVSRPGRRTDQEEEPLRGTRAPTHSFSPETRGNRRECHVFAS